jgi:hypothetical protein
VAGSLDSGATRASFTSHCCTDLRQLYRLELHFRQGYAFSTTHDAADRGHPQGFQQRSPASLWFKGGKIIVYGTLLPAIARRFRVLPKAEISERCVQSFAHDPAISIANFIHPVRICARLSWCSQAVDDEDTRPGDGD